MISFGRPVPKRKSCPSEDFFASRQQAEGGGWASQLNFRNGYFIFRIARNKRLGAEKRFKIGR
jgi:hypothetical protein